MKKSYINTREFARRFGGSSIRTIERLYEEHTPDLPTIVRFNRRKLFDESEVDAFLASLPERGDQEPRAAVGAVAKTKTAPKSKQRVEAHPQAVPDD